MAVAPVCADLCRFEHGRRCLTIEDSDKDVAVNPLRVLVIETTIATPASAKSIRWEIVTAPIYITCCKLFNAASACVVATSTWPCLPRRSFLQMVDGVCCVWICVNPLTGFACASAARHAQLGPRPAILASSMASSCTQCLRDMLINSQRNLRRNNRARARLTWR